MSLDYIVVAVGVIAPYGITPGEITANDAGWSELESVSTSVPNTIATSTSPHATQPTTIALKLFVRTMVGGSVGGPWTFSATQDAGTSVGIPNGTAMLDAVLWRFGKITAITGSSAGSGTWGNGDPLFTTGPGPSPDVVLPSVGGPTPSATVLAFNAYWQIAGAIPPTDIAGSLGPIASTFWRYDGPRDITFTGQTPAPVPGATYEHNWGCVEGIAINLAGPYTVCDSDYGEMIGTPGTMTVSVTSDSPCPQPTALYGWGTLIGSGSGGAW